MSVLEAEEAVVLLLRADASVSAIVADRLYPNVAPANAAAPYLIYSRVGREDISQDLDAPGNLVQPRLQLDSYAADYAIAKALARAVRLCLNPYRGSVSSADSPPRRLRIGGVILNLELDRFESGTDPKLHRVLQDYTLTTDELATEE